MAQSAQEWHKSVVKAYLRVPKLDYNNFNKHLDDEVHDEFVRLAHPATRRAAEAMENVNRETLQQKLWDIFEDHRGLGDIEDDAEQRQVAEKIADDIFRTAVLEHYKHEGLPKSKVRKWLDKAKKDPMFWQTQSRLVFGDQRFGREQFINQLIYLAEESGEHIFDTQSDVGRKLYAGVLAYMDPNNTRLSYVKEKLQDPERFKAFKRKVEQKFGYKIRPNADPEQVIELYEQGIVLGYDNKELLRRNRRLFESAVKLKIVREYTEPIPPELSKIKEWRTYEKTAYERPQYKKVR